MSSKLQLLPEDVREGIQAVPGRAAAAHGLVALWLFGSFARGEATPISDVDFAYLLDETIITERIDRLETDLYVTLADALHSDEFTFVNLRRAPAYLAWRVLQEGQLLWCRDAGAVAELVEKTYHDAPDLRWLRHTGNADFLEGVGMPEPRIDKDRVIEFLRLINEDVQALREKGQLPKAQYVESRDLQAIVERRLQTATESCINIGNHLIARLGLRAPKDYADVFRLLAEAQVVRSDLREQMMETAKLRNLLVHVYWAIDHGRIFDSLPGRLSTLESFAQCIAQWLKQQK